MRNSPAAAPPACQGLRSSCIAGTGPARQGPTARLRGTFADLADPGDILVQAGRDVACWQPGHLRYCCVALDRRDTEARNGAVSPMALRIVFAAGMGIHVRRSRSRQACWKPAQRARVPCRRDVCLVEARGDRPCPDRGSCIPVVPDRGDLTARRGCQDGSSGIGPGEDAGRRTPARYRLAVSPHAW